MGLSFSDCACGLGENTKNKDHKLFDTGSDSDYEYNDSDSNSTSSPSSSSSSLSIKKQCPNQPKRNRINRKIKQIKHKNKKRKSKKKSAKKSKQIVINTEKQKTKSNSQIIQSSSSNKLDYEDLIRTLSNLTSKHDDDLDDIDIDINIADINLNSTNNSLEIDYARTYSNQSNNNINNIHDDINSDSDESFNSIKVMSRNTSEMDMDMDMDMGMSDDAPSGSISMNNGTVIYHDDSDHDNQSISHLSMSNGSLIKPQIINNNDNNNNMYQSLLPFNDKIEYIDHNRSHSVGAFIGSGSGSVFGYHDNNHNNNNNGSQTLGVLIDYPLVSNRNRLSDPMLKNLLPLAPLPSLSASISKSQNELHSTTRSQSNQSNNTINKPQLNMYAHSTNNNRYYHKSSHSANCHWNINNDNNNNNNNNTRTKRSKNKVISKRRRSNIMSLNNKNDWSLNDIDNTRKEMEKHFQHLTTQQNQYRQSHTSSSNASENVSNWIYSTSLSE